MQRRPIVSRLRFVPFLLSGCWLYSGCASEETGYYPRPDSSDTAADSADIADDGSGDATPSAAWVGAACETNAECGTAAGTQCLKAETLATLGLDGLDVPGGLCSKLFCTADAECGDGAVCFDSQPFTGSPIKLCLQTCDDLAACRWEEAYTCFLPDSADTETALGACLPDAIAVAILCDDGHCE